MRLYRSRDLPGRWVGEDQEGALMVWPAEKRGWSRRTAYVGSRRALEEVEPALARGTGWPGGGRAHHPRSPSGRPSQPVSVRATEEERAAWVGAAKRAKRTLSEWCRDELNAAAGRIGDETTRLTEAALDRARSRTPDTRRRYPVAGLQSLAAPGTRRR